MLVDSPELQNEVCQSFVQNLADLHTLDYTAAGLGELGKPVGYCRRQVEGWAKRYFAAKTDEWPEIESVIVWLNLNIPPEAGAALIHNDYKFDNIMLNPNDLTRITAVLDWEMATLGDPLADLGYLTATYADADEPFTPMELTPVTRLPGYLRRQELIDRKLDVHWGINTRVTDILRDEDLLPFYRKAGLVHISLGTEAAAQRPFRDARADRLAANAFQRGEDEVTAIEHRNWQQVDESEIN